MLECESELAIICVLIASGTTFICTLHIHIAAIGFFRYIKTQLHNEV